MKRSLLAFAAAALAFVFVHGAYAQAYPSKPA